MSTSDEETGNLQMEELRTCFGMGIALLSIQIEVRGGPLFRGFLPELRWCEDTTSSPLEEIRDQILI